MEARTTSTMFARTVCRLCGEPRFHKGLRIFTQPYSSTLFPRIKRRASSEPPVEKINWRERRMKAKAKLVGGMWRPSKRLSPDATEGVRALHAQHPDFYTHEKLAEEFEVPFEAIRRILKSKFQPTEEQAERRRVQWDKRGQKIWSNLVREGLKPPKKWREMGIGRRPSGILPSKSHSGSPQTANEERELLDSAGLLAQRVSGKSTPDNRAKQRNRGSFSEKLL